MEDGIVENKGEASTSKPTPELINVELDQKRIIAQKLQNNINKSFNNSMHSDIDIVIDYKVIKGHKLILSQNPSFRKMFAEAPDLKQISLSDEISDSVESDIKYLFCSELDQEGKDDFLKFSSEACETFLWYIYATEIEREKVNLDLILIAHKFTDDNLKQFCENHLIKNVNMQNAIQTLLVSLKTDCKKLKKQACVLMARNFCEMKFNKNFNLVLENDNAMSAILDVFDECHTTVLTDRLYKYEDLEEKMNFLRIADLLMNVGNYHFLVHKDILSEENPVFKMIIDTASTDGFPTSVNIPDVDQSTFKIFLHYIYAKELDRRDISKELFELAHKYTHETLKQDCEEEFINSLNYENVIDSLIIATEFKCERLEMVTSNSIIMRFNEIKIRRDFPMLMKNPDAATVIVNTFQEHLIINNPSTHFSNEFVFDNFNDGRIKTFQVNKHFNLQILRFNSTVNVLLNLVQNEEYTFHVCCSFELISTTNTQHNISRLLYHDYTSNYVARWYDCLSWSDFEDPKYGYIKDGKVRLRLQLDVIKFNKIP